MTTADNDPDVWGTRRQPRRPLLCGSMLFYIGLNFIVGAIAGGVLGAHFGPAEDKFEARSEWNMVTETDDVSVRNATLAGGAVAAIAALIGIGTYNSRLPPAPLRK